MYISRIEEGSVAERAGLRPGDSILEVNGTPFTAISHDEALKVNLRCACFILNDFLPQFFYKRFYSIFIYF